MFQEFLNYVQSSRRYKKGTVKLFKYYIGRFAAWLQQQGVADVSGITDELVQQFLDGSNWADNTRRIFIRFYLKDLIGYYKNGAPPEPPAPPEDPDGEPGSGEGEEEPADPPTQPAAGEAANPPHDRAHPPVRRAGSPVVPMDVKKRSHKGTLRSVPTRQDVLKQLPPREMFKIYGMDEEKHSTPIGSYSMRDVMPWGGVEPFIQQNLALEHPYVAYPVYYIDEAGNEVPQATVRPLKLKPGEQTPYVETLEEIRRQQHDDQRARAKKLDELTDTFMKAWSEGKTGTGGAGAGGDTFGKMIEYRILTELMGHMGGRPNQAMDAAIEEIKRLQAEGQQRAAQGQPPLSAMEKMAEMKMLMTMVDEMFPRRRREEDDDERGIMPMPQLPPPPVEPRRSAVEDALAMIEAVAKIMPKQEGPHTDPAVMAQIEVMKVHLENATRQNEALQNKLDQLNAPGEQSQPHSTFGALADELRAAKQVLAEFNNGAGAGKGETSMVDFLDNLVDRLPEIVHEIGRVAALSDGKKKSEKNTETGKTKKNKSSDAKTFVRLLEGAKDDEELMQYLMMMFQRISAKPEQAKVARAVLEARGKKLQAYVGKILERLPFDDGVPKGMTARIIGLIQSNRSSMLKGLSAS